MIVWIRSILPALVSSTIGRAVGIVKISRIVFRIRQWNWLNYRPVPGAEVDSQAKIVWGIKIIKRWLAFMPSEHHAKSFVPQWHVEMVGGVGITCISVVDMGIEKHNPGMESAEHVSEVFKGKYFSSVKGFLNEMTKAIRLKDRMLITSMTILAAFSLSLPWVLLKPGCPKSAVVSWGTSLKPILSEWDRRVSP